MRATTDASALRGDASYLITGGLGVLGRAVARHFIERGAGSVVLAGRHAPSPELAEELALLGADGRVRTVTLDLADRSLRVEPRCPALARHDLGVSHRRGARARKLAV